MTQIKLRRDTSANFASKNPVLGIGEPAYETDTKKLKIGDGTTAYTQLEYFSMTDEFATYREKYGAPSDSVPVVNTGNSITIKAGVSIETPNGTLTNATDMTYTYDFLTDRVLFVTENDYYHAYAVYYGGREPSPAGEQIFWFNNNVWTMISGNGTKTVFNTQKITPIAKIYQVNGTVKNIDYLSYTKTSTGGGGSSAPENMVTTDTAQTITGSKTFNGTVTLKSAEIGNQISALQLPLYTSNATRTLTPIVQSYTDLDNPVSELRFGSINNRLQIRGSKVVDKNNKRFLTQGSITAGDNIVVTETSDGIQISTTEIINSPSIDGDWTYKKLTLADTVSLPVNTEGVGGVFTYDLSNYLPNDGYKYEVTISVEVNNSSFCTLGYYLPDNSWYSFAKGANPIGGWFNAIVDSSRQVKISVVNTQEALMWANAAAYRRLGKKV